MSRYRTAWRKGINAVMLGLTSACMLLTVSILFFILGYLVWHGGKDVTWNFFTKLPAPVGERGGGMANAIVGTAKLLLLAMVFGVPVGVMTGIYLSEFGGKTFGFLVRYTTDLLNGVPSIVIGIFAYAVVVLPMRHFSTLAGGFALGVMTIPITVRSTEEFLRAVPTHLREGALALGASKWKAIVTVVLPAASAGIITGVMLALARVAGETAPLLFTAFGNQFWSDGWSQPIASLPMMIYTYAISAYESWHEQAWAAALVLLALVLVVNVATRLILSRRISVSR
ncbi:MAG TPA: phosphate ABC transporter permease PstA [Candidatus Acidoferrales bacterium]|nr:phosphate ABC transporter permease PstA [Candidatus Acidoferrales bacterium]